jgi:hypothetical protein
MWLTGKQNITVYHVNMTVTKMADPEFVFVWTLGFKTVGA